MAALAALCTAGAIKSNSDAATGVVTFAIPRQIGSLRKSADQSAAATLLARLNASGADKTFAVIYDDTTAEGHTADAWRISSWQLRDLSLQRRLDLFFTSASQHVGDKVLGTRVDVGPGAVAGKAQCASAEGSSEATTACAWAAGKATAIAFLFTGRGPDECGDLVRRMLSAIVTKD